MKEQDDRFAMVNKKQKKEKLISRRTFFRRFFAEAVSTTEEIKGKPQLMTSDIFNLPDETIRKMEPVIQNNNAFYIEDNILFKASDGLEPDMELKYFDLFEGFVVDQFNGQETIKTISLQAADEFGMDEETAYNKIKSLFISLSEYAISYPLRPLDAYLAGEDTQ